MGGTLDHVPGSIYDPVLPPGTPYLPARISTGSSVLGAVSVIEGSRAVWTLCTLYGTLYLDLPEYCLRLSSHFPDPILDDE